MTIVEALIELQEVDGRIREFEAELKDLPRRKALEKARLTGVSVDLAAAKADQLQAENRVNGYDSDADSIQARIAELKQTQLNLKTNKEYQDFSAQIETLQKQYEAAKNNSQAAVDFLEPAQRRIDDAMAKFEAQKSGVDQYCAEIDARIAEVSEELKAAQAERIEKAKLVTDPKFLLYYERLRTKRWPVVVALTHDGVCDGCHLVQPPSVGQMADANVRNGEAGRPQVIVACTMCGRLLYR